MAKVVVYSAGYCGFCVRAKMLLERKGVEYTEVMVDRDPVQRAELQKLTGQRTVPQVFIGRTHVGGFDELYQLEREGKLDELIAAEQP